MCTIFIAIDSHPSFPLLIAGNRDEFYQRATAPLQDWGGLVGGRDLQQGGHWLAADKQGRWAALTNYRGAEHKVNTPHTRGDLVKDYLQQALSIDAYVEGIQSSDREYEGFNLLLGDAEGGVAHYSNITAELTYLSAGIYGMSNALLDTPWPKVAQGKAAFKQLLQSGEAVSPDKVFALLRDRTQADRNELPNTGVPVLMEQLLSSLFIHSPVYGTRSSALLSRSKQGKLTFVEQGYTVLGRKGRMLSLEFPVAAIT